MRSKGFSLIELLLIIALTSILAAGSVPFLSNTIGRSNARSVEEKILSSLRKAQSYSKTKKNGTVWGVCQNGSTIRLYRGGTCASPTYSEDFLVPASISVSGLTNLTFDQIRGLPSSSATITISSATDSYAISVNSAGLINNN